MPKKEKNCWDCWRKLGFEWKLSLHLFVIVFLISLLCVFGFLFLDEIAVMLEVLFLRSSKVLFVAQISVIFLMRFPFYLSSKCIYTNQYCYVCRLAVLVLVAEPMWYLNEMIYVKWLHSSFSFHKMVCMSSLYSQGWYILLLYFALSISRKINLLN